MDSDSPVAASATEHKARENRLRRKAQRHGLLLVKSRRRDTDAPDFGLYVLVRDTRGNRLPGAQAPITAFARGHGRTLDQIERELTGGRARSPSDPQQGRSP